MKIRRIILYISIFLFILFFPTIFFYFSNLIFEKNFIYANKLNSHLEKVFTNNDYLKFKKGDFYYKYLEYGKSLDYYLKVKCKNDDHCLKLNHNIWNAFYKLWSSNENNSRKIFYRQNALNNYSKWLTYKYDEETKYNYDYVLKRLEELKNKQEEEKKEKEKKEEENKPAENQKEQEEKEAQDWENIENNWQKEQESDEQKEQKTIPKWPSMQISPEEENAKKPLKPEEKETIEKYLEYLKQEEKQNLNLNKPKQNRDIFDILENDFFQWFDNWAWEW